VNLSGVHILWPPPGAAWGFVHREKNKFLMKNNAFLVERISRSGAKK
jgi:hypothetical protein